MGNEEREGTSEERDRDAEALDERKRQDEEKAEDNRRRQVRQGVIPDPNAEESESKSE